LKAVESALTPDPKKRPTAAELLDMAPSIISPELQMLLLLQQLIADVNDDEIDEDELRDKVLEVMKCKVFIFLLIILYFFY
jgi:hypothetical protein